MPPFKITGAFLYIFSYTASNACGFFGLVMPFEVLFSAYQEVNL